MLLILLAGLAIWARYSWKSYIINQIKEIVYKSTSGFYIVELKNVRYSFSKQVLELDSFRIHKNPKFKNTENKLLKGQKYTYDIFIPRLSLTTIRPLKIYTTRKIETGALVIDHPAIKITDTGLKSQSNASEKSKLHHQLQKFLKKVSVKDLLINNASLSFISNHKKSKDSIKVKHLTFKMQDVQIDSASDADAKRFLYAKDVSLSIKGQDFNTKDGLYNISFNGAEASFLKKSIRIKKLKIKPMYPEMEFSRKFSTQHDRYDMFFESILFKTVDFNGLGDDGRLFISALVIDNADINIFMNRAMPPVTFDKGRNYPHNALKRLKWHTTIDTAIIKNSSIKYSEYNPASRKKGIVVFGDFYASILNITNDPLSLAKKHWAHSSASARLMNTAKLNVKINFHLTSKSSEFNFAGTAGRMELQKLNPLLRSLALAEIKTGTLKKAEFDVKGNWNSSSGYIKFYYNDLKITVLKRNEEQPSLKKKGTISALANFILIKNDNPDKDGKLRIGNTIAQRKPSASFFNLMWTSVFEGIKETVISASPDPGKKSITESAEKKSKKQLRRERRKARQLKKND